MINGIEQEIKSKGIAVSRRGLSDFNPVNRVKLNETKVLWVVRLSKKKDEKFSVKNAKQKNYFILKISIKNHQIYTT